MNVQTKAPESNSAQHIHDEEGDKMKKQITVLTNVVKQLVTRNASQEEKPAFIPQANVLVKGSSYTDDPSGSIDISGLYDGWSSLVSAEAEEESDDMPELRESDSDSDSEEDLDFQRYDNEGHYQPYDDMPELRSDSDSDRGEEDLDFQMYDNEGHYQPYDVPVSSSDDAEGDDWIYEEYTEKELAKQERQERKRTATQQEDQVESNHLIETLPISNGPITTTKLETELPEEKTGNRFSIVSLLFLLMVIVSQFFVASQTGVANALTTGSKDLRQHEILLDTGCSNSSTGMLSWLVNKESVNFQMRTANDGTSTASCKGTAIICGVPIRVLHIADFRRTLIAWTDLADMGFTGTMGLDTITIKDMNGKMWTKVNRGSDRLWHFTDAEKETSSL
jgi:hypothetical protein